MSILDLLLEPLQYEFMLRALLATTVAAVVCALISCWLVLIGWSLMGDAIAHSVFPGVVIAYALGAPFALGALAFAFLAVGLIGAVRSTRTVREDAAIGIVFTSLFALGLVLISVTPSQIDLGHIVFGNVLGVSALDLLQIAVIAGIVAVVVIVKRRDLTLVAFDRAHAHAIGIDPRLITALLLGLLALTTVVALQIVGVILVIAMLVIPGVTARLLSDRLRRMLVIAPSIAAGSSIVGIYLSYWLDASPAGLVVLVQAGVFTAVAAWSHARQARHGRSRTLRAGGASILSQQHSA